ncbi:MAG: hypothetical protein M3Q44_01070 [bacterium]|nr:hypothetical protein [bacterium]
MEQLNSFSFDSAFIFLIKIIFAVISFGLVGFVFLILRQVQTMNRVLSTQLASIFIVCSIFLLLSAIGLFCLVLLTFSA